MTEVTCSHCGHKQKTKTKLNKVTCSNCQKKFNINSPREENPEQSGIINPTNLDAHNNKEVTPRVKLD